MSTQLSIKDYFAKPEIEQKLAELVGENSKSYLMSALNVVNGNTNLSGCSPKSVLNGVLMAAVLGFPINNNIGYAYIVPYGSEAQFQLGYKGFVQLAIRSGQYKYINATPIYKGQLIKNDPLSGFAFDFNVTKSGEPIGYASEFMLHNGFQKTIYMTVAEITDHGKKYSKTFTMNNSTWKKEFHGMALKTVVKLNLSKWGVLSVDMQKAIQSDQTVVTDPENGYGEYVDNGNDSNADPINAEFEEMADEDLV